MKKPRKVQKAASTTLLARRAQQLAVASFKSSQKAVSTPLLARRAELLAVASKGGLTLPGWRGRILMVKETELAMASKAAREASSSIVGIL